MTGHPAPKSLHLPGGVAPLLAALAAIVAMGAALPACVAADQSDGNGSANGNAARASNAPEPLESEPVVEDVPSACDVADCWPPPNPVDTLDELFAEADFVALVRAERQLETAWVGIAPWPISRFELTVQESFLEDLGPEGLVVGHLPGGESAVTGNPWMAGGFAPKPGEPAVIQRFAESPPFQLGRRELVFFREVEWPDGSVKLYPLSIGRYRVEQGELYPLFGAQHPLFERLAPQPLRDELTGKTLAEFRALADAAASRMAAVPIEPLHIAAEPNLARYRERLGTEMAFVARAAEDIESGAAEAVARSKHWQDVTCAAPASGSFIPECATLGIPEGSPIQAEYTDRRLFGDPGPTPWMERDAWLRGLEALIQGSNPELVAAVAGADSNRLYLFFALTGGRCMGVAFAPLSTTPLLSFHALPTCPAMFSEVRAYQDRTGGTLEVLALADGLRE